MGKPLDLPIGRVVDLGAEHVRRFRPAYRIYLLQWAGVLAGAGRAADVAVGHGYSLLMRGAHRAVTFRCPSSAE